MNQRQLRLILGLILLVSLVLRFWKLDFQSFWLDECHTAIVANPEKGWSWLFYHLRCCEYHPPLLYIMERFLFSVFGYTEFTARSLTAVAGTASVLAIYFLGKELHCQRCGLAAAALTSVNYFNIWHSQDARPYILAFLFATLSFLFFIRFLRQRNRKAAVFYAASTLMLLYTHYYSLFIVAAQACITGLFWVLEKENRGRLFRNYALSAGIILAGYLPWLPFLLSMSAVDSIWMSRPDGNFPINFFHEYFGHSGLLRPLLVLLLIFYCFRVFQSEKPAGGKLGDDPLLFSFVLFIFWIGFTYLAPYLRSMLSVPMLQARYTIVALPAFLLMLAISIEEIRNELIRYMTLSLFVALSVISLIFVNRHYSEVKKTQFREMTAYISADPNERYPIVNERTAWQQAYYLERFGNEAPVLTGKKEDIIDSILQKSSEKYNLPAFWLVGAHGGLPLADKRQQVLEQSYHLLKERSFHDAWAQLYTARKEDILVNHQYFDSSQVIVTDGERIVPVWAGEVRSSPVLLTAGRYLISVAAKGTPLDGVYPEVLVSAGGLPIGSFTASSEFRTFEWPIELDADVELPFSVSLANDADDPETGQDRNVFIRYIRCKKITATEN